MVAGAPVFGSVEGADGQAMGYRPGREPVVELGVRLGRVLPVEISSDSSTATPTR